MMKLSLAKNLGLRIEKTKVSAQKINNFKLKTFRKVIIFFLINNKIKRS